MDKKKEAKRLYEQGYQYKDIANEVGAKLNTVRSWRARDKWQRGSSNKNAAKSMQDKMHSKDATDASMHASMNARKTDAKSDVIDGKLSPQQIRFADRYIATGNAKQSALDAGYSESTARKAKEQLIGDNRCLKSYIDNQVSKLQQPEIMSAEEIMKFLTDVIKGDQIETISLATPDGVEQVDQPADIKTKIAAARELLKRYPTGDKLLEAKIAKLEAEARIKVVQADEVEPDNTTKSDKEFSKLTEGDLRRLANNDGKFKQSHDLDE